MVPPHRRGSRRLVGPRAGALLALLLAGACTAESPQRALPLDGTAPLLYVALGDSTVEGVGARHPAGGYVHHLYARLRTRYPAARLVNLGVGGATAADVRELQLPRALALRPHVVTLSVGPNDVVRGVPAATYRSQMQAILEALAHSTEAVIVVNLLPDLTVTRRFRHSPEAPLVGRRTAELNAILRDLARTYPVVLVDLYMASRREVPARPELLAEDGYHPSDAGHARWAELMWEALGRRVARGR